MFYLEVVRDSHTKKEGNFREVLANKKNMLEALLTIKKAK
jgi:hypothetical protein